MATPYGNVSFHDRLIFFDPEMKTESNREKKLRFSQEIPEHSYFLSEKCHLHTIFYIKTFPFFLLKFKSILIRF